MNNTAMYILNEYRRPLFALVLFLTVIFTVPHFIALIAPHPAPASVSDPTPHPLFTSLNFEARGVYVYDAARGEVLYAQNEHAQLPLASLTKIMTALVAEESVPSYTMIPITSEALTPEGDSGLYVGDRWRIAELLKYMLVSSSNDAARAVAAVGAIAVPGDDERTPEERFVDQMNAYAESLGLSQTFFLNESGLDASEAFSGSYGSARDVAHLILHAAAHQPDLFEATTFAQSELSSAGFSYTAENTNDIIDRIPGLIASKTGYTDLAGGNLAVVFNVEPAHPIAVVVLGSTQEGRFADVEKLVWAAIGAVADQKDR